MELVEKLEAAARDLELDLWVGGYNQDVADLRELLEEAAQALKEGGSHD